MTDQQRSESARPGKLTLYSLAMVGGLGITLMMTAAMVGVVFGGALDAESTHALGLLLVCGFMLLAAAIGFWLGWVRPFEGFDDINVPAEPGPH